MEEVPPSTGDHIVRGLDRDIYRSFGFQHCSGQRDQAGGNGLLFDLLGKRMSALDILPAAFGLTTVLIARASNSVDIRGFR